jgi:hypothetical protein
MHPTQNSAAALSITPTADQIEKARAYLAGYDTDDRYPVMVGTLTGTLKAIAIIADSGTPIDHLIRTALADVAAFEQLAATPVLNQYTREDPVDPNFVLPEGIEGFALGRWAR